eukprot:TRINITY_DN10530_c0_g1_i2.p1 TRINITY_DN10530_c0_g1~~TRINITY_DN10530_c0_g1_i2.p1  ORF type:complete len:241 (+),score=43.39 TRINITY_DN10530_c0_g1_i2:159-881(+)
MMSATRTPMAQGDADHGSQPFDRPTTLMLMNIPCRAKCHEIRHVVDAAGYQGTYDFFYLPHRHGLARRNSTQTHYGYAFINFKSSCYSMDFLKTLEARSMWLRNKRLTGSIARVQGADNVTLAWKRKSPSSEPWIANDGGAHELASCEEETSSHEGGSDGPGSTQLTASVCSQGVMVDARPKYIAMNAAFFQLGVPSAMLACAGSAAASKEPMLIEVDTEYFEEDAYLATGVHEFKLYSL